MSLKDEILALREKYAPKPVEVAVDGTTVHVHALSMADRVDFDARAAGDRLVLVVMRCARDEAGKRIFSDSEADTVRTLPDEFSLPVWDAAIALSGLKKPEEVAAGETGKANGSPPSPASSSS